MSDNHPIAGAARELAAALRERAIDGHLRLDEYLEVVGEVADSHGHDRDALHEWFASNDGRDRAVTLAGSGVGSP